MPRKLSVDGINLSVDNVEIFKNKATPHGTIRISWSSDIGFGQYELTLDENGIINADSECMDTNNDKSFLKKLLELLTENAVIL